MQLYTPARAREPRASSPIREAGKRTGLPGLEAEYQTWLPAMLSARPLLGQAGVTGAHLPVRSRAACLTPLPLTLAELVLLVLALGFGACGPSRFLGQR